MAVLKTGTRRVGKSVPAGVRQTAVDSFLPDTAMGHPDVEKQVPVTDTPEIPGAPMSCRLAEVKKGVGR